MNEASFAFVVALFIGLMIGLTLGIQSGVNSSNTQAIEAGVAEYQIDRITGEKRFVYITK